MVDTDKVKKELEDCQVMWQSVNNIELTPDSNGNKIELVGISNFEMIDLIAESSCPECGEKLARVRAVVHLMVEVDVRMGE